MTTETTKAREMTSWAQTWADVFAPYVADDNDWYRDGGIDGKDAGDLGEGLAEVARLLIVAQERIAALEDAAQALAVLDRLMARAHRGDHVSLYRLSNGTIWATYGDEIANDLEAEEPTVAAALLALGARLEEGD